MDGGAEEVSMSDEKKPGKSAIRYVVLLLIVAAAVLLPLCLAKFGKGKDGKNVFTPLPSADEDTMRKIKSIDGILLTIGVDDIGLIDYVNDQTRGSSYELHYNGKLIRKSYHSNSDPEVHTVMIPDNDLYYFYQFCKEYGDGSEFSGHQEDVCDGEMYYFTYYDEVGMKHSIFGGYCYQIDVLQDIAKHACSFFYPDYSIPCRQELAARPELLDTVTNLCSPEIEKLTSLPEGCWVELGYEEYSSDFYYEYTYSTTEDAEKGPIVFYLSKNGVRLAMKNNRTWDRDDVIIEVNGKTLTATLAYKACGEALYQMLQEGPLTIEMKMERHSVLYGGDRIEGEMPSAFYNANPARNHGRPGDIIGFYQDTKLCILTEEMDDLRHVVVGRINSISEEELKEILGDGEYTVVISLPTSQ